jgi:hypothetical protein
VDRDAAGAQSYTTSTAAITLTQTATSSNVVDIRLHRSLISAAAFGPLLRFCREVGPMLLKRIFFGSLLWPCWRGGIAQAVQGHRHEFRNAPLGGARRVCPALGDGYHYRICRRRADQRVQLDSAYNRISTVASANDSVKLPPCRVGATNTGPSGAFGIIPGDTQGVTVWMTNAAAANSMNVFPATGDAINALSANSAYAMAANKTAAFICGTSGIWYSVLGG